MPLVPQVNVPAHSAATRSPSSTFRLCGPCSKILTHGSFSGGAILRRISLQSGGRKPPVRRTTIVTVRVLAPGFAGLAWRGNKGRGHAVGFFFEEKIRHRGRTPFRQRPAGSSNESSVVSPHRYSEDEDGATGGSAECTEGPGSPAWNAAVPFVHPAFSPVRTGVSALHSCARL